MIVSSRLLAAFGLALSGVAVAASRGNQIHVYDAGSGAFVRSLTDPTLTTPDKKPLKPGSTLKLSRY